MGKEQGWPKGKPRGPMSTEHRQAISRATVWPRGSHKSIILRKPKISEAAYKVKLSEAARRRWQSPQERERQRQRALPRPSSFYNKMRAAQREWSHSPEGIARLREARMAQTYPKRMTDLERALYHEFKKRRLKFEMHKTMYGRFQPDFVFEGVRLIVQADGQYWHKKPGVKERDRRFNESAIGDGWTVWRFAETEIKMHPQACGRAVARFIRSH